MFVLYSHFMDSANIIAVSQDKKKLEDKLKETAREYCMARCYDPDGMEEMGWDKSIANASDSWCDEDDECPYTLEIDEAEEL